MEAVLMMLKPASPPKVEGFQYLGEQMGLARRPLTLQGPPVLTMVRGVTEGPGRSARRPENLGDAYEYARSHYGST